MNSIIALVGVVWIGWIAESLGRLLLNAMGFRFSALLERWAFSFALGAGILAYFIFFLGLCRLFHPAAFLGAAIALSIFFLAQKFISKTSERISFREIFDPAYLPLTALFLLAIVQALIPSTAHDALAYQLDIPKRFVQAGGIVYLPYSVNSTFPLLMNMYYVVALLWNSTQLANLLQLMHGFGIAIGILALARNHLPKFYAVLAAFLFCVTPAIFNQMIIAYNDIAFCFYFFFALFAACRWDEKRDIRWIVLSGMFTGFALSVKYLGAFAGVLIGILLIFRLIRREVSRGNFFKAGIAFSFSALLFSFVWYVRCYFYEGQFLYFGQIGYEATNQTHLLKYLATPFLITFFPERFGGSWTQIGPVYLAFLPLLFFIKPLSPWAKKILFFGAGYFLLWLFLPRQNLRFLFSALPFFALLIAYALHALAWDLKLKRVLFFLLGFAFLLELGLAVYHGKGGYRVVLGLESEAAYLEGAERTSRLAAFMNLHLPQGAKVLNAYEVRMFYIDAQLIREAEYRGKTKYDQKAATPEDLIKVLKQDGFTHILWTPGYEGPRSEMSIPQLLSEGKISGNFLEEIYREPESAAQTRYLLYAIR